jgi:ATP-binding cassette subfamily B protein
LRVEIFRHIHRLSLSYFTRHEAGDVMTRITMDADTIQQAISFPLIGVTQGVLLIVWLAFTMFSKSVSYALVTLAVVPFMFAATLWFSAQARKAFRNVRSRVGDVNAELQENLAAVREVQAFGREDENIRDFNQSNAAAREASIRAVSYTSALGPTLEALGYLSVALVAGVGGLVMLGGGTLGGTTMSLGLIITFISYAQRFNMPIQQISVMWTNIQSAIAGGERIFGLLDTPPDLKDKPDARVMPPITGRVAFDNVSSEYEAGELVLKGVSLVAEPGQTVAIVGPTGAGKTTIINLIPRFYDVKDGAVTIDGIDVRDVTAASLRAQIGIVLQDSFLFSDTIMNNIRYGRPDASDDDVYAAARLARADAFIERMPDGYKTMLGERGSGLSQGQRQLISIARAALANPRILILDEATSSVDTRTERLIQTALLDLLRGRTSFVIAHRLSTIRNADQVLVLKDGQIIERGKHEELLRAGGFYHSLYMSQFQAEDAAA